MGQGSSYGKPRALQNLHPPRAPRDFCRDLSSHSFLAFSSFRQTSIYRISPGFAHPGDQLFIAGSGFDTTLANQHGELQTNRPAALAAMASAQQHILI
jgi:hypothetical protein